MSQGLVFSDVEKLQMYMASWVPGRTPKRSEQGEYE